MKRTTKGEGIFRLDDRVAFVSGASGHLGRAIVGVLAEAGATVIINGRTAEKLEQLREELADYGDRIETMAFDVTDAPAVDRSFNEITERHDALDVLINNAYAGEPGSIESATANDFASAYGVAVTGAFNCVKAASPGLRAAVEINGDASVINVASMYGSVSPDPRVYGDTGLDNPPYYGAAKGGLIQLGRYLACHLAVQRIRVNTLSPGPFPPSSVVEASPSFGANLCAKVPLNRLGEPDDLKGAVLFLASSASAYVTGINLPVDGGWTTW